MPLSKLNKQGQITARLTIDLIRVTMLAFEKSGDFEATASEVLLGAAIYMAQAEGRPMTAAKAAAYVGIPRPTAIRKLAQMRERGMLEVSDAGLWKAAVGPPENKAILAGIIREKMRLIRKASTALSKLDGRTVADNESD